MENDWWRRLVEAARKILQEDERRRARNPQAPPERVRLGPPNDPIRVIIITQRGKEVETWIDPDMFDDFRSRARSGKGVTVRETQLGRTRTNVYRRVRDVVKG